MASTSSAVWNYFTMETADSAKCKCCEKVYSRKGRGTTSLKNHLKAVHKEQYDMLIQVENEAKMERQRKITPSEKLKTELKQKTLDTLLQVKMWDSKCPKSKEADKKVCEMLIMDDLPFSHVEDIGFTRLINFFSPQYNLKKRKFYSSLICNDMYESVCLVVQSRLNEVMGNCGLSFTTDVWSDTSAGVSLLSLTAHVIDNSFIRREFLLCAEVLDDRNTGQYLSEKIDSMLNKWNISKSDVHCIVRDAGANIKKALQLVGTINVDCTIHKLQNNVKEALLSQKAVKNVITKCRNIATHFNHSVAAQHDLKKQQEKLQQPQLNVIHDTPTRWNSTLHMMQRISDVKESLILYEASVKKVTQNMLTSNEWITTENVIKALKPYEDITKRLSDANASIAEVIPHLNSLRAFLSTSSSSPSCSESSEPTADPLQNITQMNNTLKRELDLKFDLIETNDIFGIATFLDPRYKHKLFKSSVLTMVKNKIAQLLSESTSEIAIEEEPPKKRLKTSKVLETEVSTESTITDAMNAILASSSDEEQEVRVDNEAYETIDMYCKEKRQSLDTDPLEWWKTNRKKYPTLSRLARRYLACPPSSVPSERLFSSASNIYDEKRNRLKGETAEKLLFMKYNLPLINFTYT